MPVTNALLLQEDLRQQEYVTVPWLQAEYDMTYCEARSLLLQLQKRGWVEAESQDIRFRVRPKNLCMRRIRRDEVDDLYENINGDNLNALTCLEEMAGEGASKAVLERSVHGEDDTEAAINALLERKLIFEVDDLYYLAVSNRTVKVLQNVDAEKRRSTIRRKMDKSGDLEAEIKKLFDVLFEDWV